MSTTTASPEGSSLSSDPLTPGERSFVDGVIDDLAGLIPRAVEQNDASGLGMKGLTAEKITQSISMLRRGLGADTGDSVLAGPIYTSPPDPKACGLCGKSGMKLSMQLRDLWECSHIECPLRKSPTAKRSQP